MNELKRYQRYVEKRLSALIPVFANASVGNFSKDVRIPNKDDEFTELYVGVQIMLDVIREQLEELQSELVVEKERERQLASEKAQGEALLESIGEGIIAVDRSGKAITVNRAAEIMLGIKSERTVGRDWLRKERIQDEKGATLPAWQRPLQRALLRGKRVSGTYTFIRRDGTTFPASVTAAPILIGGTVVGAIKVFRDVTQEHAIDRAKSEFVSLASHQLRTPLTTVRWYSERMLGPHAPPLDKQAQRYVEEIYRSNLRLIDLVNALLNVSRIELGTVAIDSHPADLISVIDGVLRDIGPQLHAKRIKIIRRVTGPIPRLLLDVKLLGIVLQNVLTNAVKYSRPGGSIRVGVSRPASGLMISVRDNGIGIPVDQQDKIFTKLFRADNARAIQPDGTGLGLYIARSVVERSGGKIWFKSQPRRGTTFFIQLPREGMTRIMGTKGLSVG